ncbi:MAG: ParA family protein [Singulisphaera sp.]|nr:ParA family protein [Singulisphaera sp.]
MGHVISFLNLKGGVGKTSTCHHLAGTFARMGKRVLLLDNDPQASLTQGFYGPAALGSITADESIAGLYDEDATPSPAALVRPTGVDGVWIIPGSPHLAVVNTTPAQEWGPLETGLRDFLAPIRNSFDLTLVDNPPNLYLCARASLVASDYLVVPLQAEDYGAQGLGPVRSAVGAVQTGPNSGLCLAGYLVTMYDQRLAVHQSYDAILRESFGSDVFAARVPRAKDFVEAVAARMPVSHFKPRSAAAKAVQAVAEELLVRVGSGALDVRGVA